MFDIILHLDVRYINHETYRHEVQFLTLESIYFNSIIPSVVIIILLFGALLPHRLWRILNVFT